MDTAQIIADARSRGRLIGHCARRTRCAKGHEFTPENTLRRAGRRHCRACQREWARRWRARNAA